MLPPKDEMMSKVLRTEANAVASRAFSQLRWGGLAATDEEVAAIATSPGVSINALQWDQAHLANGKALLSDAQRTALVQALITTGNPHLCFQGVLAVGPEEKLVEVARQDASCCYVLMRRVFAEVRPQFFPVLFLDPEQTYFAAVRVPGGLDNEELLTAAFSYEPNVHKLVKLLAKTGRELPVQARPRAVDALL